MFNLLPQMNHQENERLIPILMYCRFRRSETHNKQVPLY